MMLPWDRLLHLAAVRIGWSPEAFWAATYWELRAALGDNPGAGPLGRADLEALLQRHPDTAEPSVPTDR